MKQATLPCERGVLAESNEDGCFLFSTGDASISSVDAWRTSASETPLPPLLKPDLDGVVVPSPSDSCTRRHTAVMTYWGWGRGRIFCRVFYSQQHEYMKQATLPCERERERELAPRVFPEGIEDGSTVVETWVSSCTGFPVFTRFLLPAVCNGGSVADVFSGTSFWVSATHNVKSLLFFGYTQTRSVCIGLNYLFVINHAHRGDFRAVFKRRLLSVHSVPIIRELPDFDGRYPSLCSVRHHHHTCTEYTRYVT
jgi:hypothetical protein